MAILQPAESFQGGSNGANVSETNTSFDNVFPIGSTWIMSDAVALPGLVRGAKVQGATVDVSGRWDLPSHTVHKHRIYCYSPGAPAASAFPYQVRNGLDTDTAMQIRHNTSNQLQLRNKFTAVGTAQTCPTNTIFALELIIQSGTMTLYCYTGANLHNTGGTGALWTTSGSITATTFGNTTLGSITAVASPGYTFTYLYSCPITDSETSAPYSEPAPPSTPDDGNHELLRLNANGTYTLYEVMRHVSPGVNTLYSIDRFVGAPPPASGWHATEKLRPLTGAIFGSTTPAEVGRGSTPAGVALMEGVTGAGTIRINHFYKTGTWSTGVNSNETTIAAGTAGDRVLLYYTWKPSSYSWGDAIVGAGLTELNSRLDAMCAQMKLYPYDFFLSFYHEPEDNVTGTGGWTLEGFRDFFRHCVTRCRLNGLDNAAFVCNFMGYRSHSSKWATMYPGDDYVDVIAWDPYGHNDDDSWADLMNDPAQPTQSLRFYNWATTARPGFSGLKPLMVGETGTDFVLTANTASPPIQPRGMTVAQAATLIGTIVPLLTSTYTQVKWVLWWNQSLIAGKNTDYIIHKSGRTAAQVALAACVQDPFFNTVTINSYPN